MGLFNFYVSFNIHDQIFAFAAKNVITIVKEGKISLNGDSSLAFGEIEVNNTSVPMVNLSKVLNLPFTIPLKNAVILVIEGKEKEQVGIIVDSIDELSLIENDSIELSKNQDSVNLGKANINNKIIHILDPVKTASLLQ